MFLRFYSIANAGTNVGDPVLVFEVSDVSPFVNWTVSSVARNPSTRCYDTSGPGTEYKVEVYKLY